MAGLILIIPYLIRTLCEPAYVQIIVVVVVRLQLLGIVMYLFLFQRNLIKQQLL